MKSIAGFEMVQKTNPPTNLNSFDIIVFNYWFDNQNTNFAKFFSRVVFSFYATLRTVINTSKIHDLSSLAFNKIDYVISLGGDGTILKIDDDVKPKTSAEDMAATLGALGVATLAAPMGAGE